MSGVPETPHPRADLIEEAAAWLAALDAGSANVAAFEAWRDADVRHAVAFAEVASTWRDLDGLRIAGGDLSTAPVAEPVADRPDRRHVLRAAASIAAVAVIGGGVAYRTGARATSITGVGERRSVAAVPGLSFDLNTDSRVHWKDGMPIRLWLEQGEVAIRLAAGHRADLRTPAGDFRLSAGIFNARMRSGGCELAVIAGTLTDDRAARLSPGDVALATVGHLGARSHGEADLARVVAWQHDTLMLSGESLDYALAEMNRYLPDKIVIGDPALSRLRIGGTFATTDPGAFLRALHASFGIHASTDATGGIVLTRA